jgi:integrase
MHIERLKSRKLEEGVTRTTVNHYLKTLRRMFNIAITWGYTDKNPVKGIKFYSENDAQRDRVLTREEEDRLLEVVSERLRSILIVGLNTGMRKGEILQLKWQDIDLENRIILVKKTKSGKPRTLPINSRLLDELKWLKEGSRNSQYLFTNSKTGGQLKTIRRVFDAACRDAKIQKLRFHDLRRTFGSRLALAGVDLNRIKELLGHASIKTTEIYLHAELKDIREAVEVLCQNPSKSGKNPGDLLHIRYMKKDDKEFNPVSSLFSEN